MKTIARTLALLQLSLLLSLSAALAGDKVYKLDVDLEGVVAGKNLRSGTYRVEVKSDDTGKGTAAFYNGYRLVAQSPCTVLEAATAADSNAVGFAVDSQGKRVISTIYIKGSKDKVVLGGPSVTNAAAR